MEQSQVIKQVLLLLFIAEQSLTNEHPHLEPFKMEEREEDPYPLINLGNSLYHRLTNIASPYGLLLYKDLQKYYNNLADVYGLLKERDVVDIVKGFKVYAELEKIGGPPHMNLTLDYQGLKRKYKWQDSGEVKDVKEVMWLTRELWEDMQDRAAHLRSGQPEPFTVEESTIDWTPFLRVVSSGSEASHY